MSSSTSAARSLFRVVVCAVLCLSCSNPSGSEVESGPDSDFDIYLPDGNTIWMLWELEVPVEYDWVAIGRASHVRMDLMKGDTLFAEFTDWYENTGSISVLEQVPDSLGMGCDYRLRIVSVDGDTAYSAEFTIEGLYLSEFIEIPAGSFMMGSEEGDWYHQPDESPAHSVTFSSPFELMSTEVRQITWENVMGENPSWNDEQPDSLPIESVSWADCQAFIEQLNDLDPYYDYRLPSEAEWEYACRAGTGTSFYWGEDNSSATVSQYAWYNPDSDGETHTVARLEPNAWGLYDMCGNVYEWCQDVYHDSYAGAPSDGSAWLSGGEQGSRIQRGGSWSNNAQFLRSPSRSSLNEPQTSIS